MCRRLMLLFCCLLACFQAIVSLNKNSSSRRNETEFPRRNEDFKDEKARPEIHLEDNSTTSRKPTPRLWIKCHPQKSCAGRCTEDRQFQRDLIGKEHPDCFCDPFCDSVFNDCCADYERECNATGMKRHLRKTELDERWKCTKIDSNRFPIWTIATCERGWKNKEIAKKCMRPNNVEVSTLIPVIDSNNLTFRNRYCAVCNGIRVYQPWEFKVKCSVVPTSVYTEEESWHFTDYFCKSEFLVRQFPSQGIRYCYDVVSKCHEQEPVDSRHRKNCVDGPTGVVSTRHEYINYKNLDCSICNGLRMPLVCGPELVKYHRSKASPRPYSAIFTSSTKNSFTSFSHCPKAHIYDSRTGDCRELVRSNIETTANSLVQKFAVTLKYQGTANKTCSIFAPELQRRFEYVFENILQVSLVESGLEFSDLGINKEENSTFLVTFQVLGLKEEFGHGNGEPLDYSKIEKLIFHASFRLGKRYGVYQYTLTTHASREMSCLHNASFPVDSSSNIFPNGTLYLNQTKSYYAKGDFLRYNETFVAICQGSKPTNCSFYDMLKNASDWTLFPNRSIYNHATNSVFVYGEYSMIGSTVWVCLTQQQADDLAKKGSRIHAPTTSIHVTILSYMTLVSLLVSILSLIAVIIVYSLNRSLRNLPGKNLMLLCLTLASAQTLWLVQGNFASFTVLCTTVAIGSHFAFLSSFCTSGSIAIHSFMTFRRLAKGKLYNANNKRAFLWYSAYSLGLPALWVMVCWLLDGLEVISLRNEGKDSCWLGGTGLKLAFLYPAAVQLFFNITTLLVTLREIHKCSETTQQLQDKNGGATNKQRVGIYLRMSALMGFSWLFGIFLAVFPGLVVFEYFFVLGNGLQGTYIALAFLFTKNVKKIMDQRLSKSTKSCSQSHVASSLKAKGESNELHEIRASTEGDRNWPSHSIPKSS